MQLPLTVHPVQGVQTSVSDAASTVRLVKGEAAGHCTWPGAEMHEENPGGGEPSHTASASAPPPVTSQART